MVINAFDACPILTSLLRKHSFKDTCMVLPHYENRLWTALAIRLTNENLTGDSSSRYFPRFLLLLHQHATLNPGGTSRKRFYDRVRVTIAIVTPRIFKSRSDEDDDDKDDDDDRLVRFHRRIYRRKTTPRVPIRSYFSPSRSGNRYFIGVQIDCKIVKVTVDPLVLFVLPKRCLFLQFVFFNLRLFGQLTAQRYFERIDIEANALIDRHHLYFGRVFHILTSFTFHH